MEKIAGNAKAQVEFTIKFILTKGEAEALDAISGYGTDNFLKVFYEHMGKTYLGALEDKLLNTIKENEALLGDKNQQDFLEIFYKQMGKTYLQPHEKSMLNLFTRIRSELPREISKIETAQKAINEVLSKFK